MGFVVTVTQEDELKSELVRRICSVLTSTVSPFRPTECIHHNNKQNIKPSFIDWYLLLGVEENAETDKIRKQYRKLALQLHPDKNQHPKAELAFKIVSEAYICLTDKAKRTAFDCQRRKNKCDECGRARRSRGRNLHKNLAKENTKSSREALKERVILENIVIENCLKAHKATSKLGEDYPVFDPANYMSQNYPHCRTQYSHRYSGDYLFPRKENVPMFSQTRGVKCESPVFNLFR
ncbi:hypothetical protein MKW94_030652 [Papaver nudicaule]|uniref:J domain-containing protein n=1 Tax=Papaver nudicaule TaxID=74823 RepID=A0AA41VB78_PAPNU|nr:hypothetical protein [Papaver nudicaule]